MKLVQPILKGTKELISIRFLEEVRSFSRKLRRAFGKSGRYYNLSFLEIPPTLQIEPTNYCNLRCICCASPKSQRKKGYMDFNLFKKILDEASEIGVKHIDLFLHGEPLLHHRFNEMLLYIKRKNLSVEIATNALLQNKDNREALLRCGLDERDVVRFSILGYSKKVHEQIQRGVNHEKAIENIHEFLLRNHKINGRKPRTKITFYEIPENSGEKHLFKKYWRGKVDHVSISLASLSFREYKKKQQFP